MHQENSVLNNRKCKVKTAAELDAEVRDILALEMVGRGDEISGTLYVDYEDEAVKNSSLITQLTIRGVDVVWRKGS
jgi:hypothetical protein